MAAAVESIDTAASRLAAHPHDHGWRDLYLLVAHGLAGDPPRAPQLANILTSTQRQRPNLSATHLVTLLGIAVKTTAGPGYADLVGTDPAQRRLNLLEQCLHDHRQAIEELLLQRQNSYTAARRFLLPQLLLSARFTSNRHPARVADLGTGLGILPRQLNCPDLFDRYAADLAWPEGVPPHYRPIPLEARYAIDRAPCPDLGWVHACHGPSAYYQQRYAELRDILNHPMVRAATVSHHELDLTDQTELRRFLTTNRINAVNLSYVLYQLTAEQRTQILNTIADSLAPPGLIIITEPTGGDLTQAGCTTTIQDHITTRPRPVCKLSDGHFRGAVTPLGAYHELGLGQDAT